jgi:hypothetical protein
MRVATAVEWASCTPATCVPRPTRESTQLSATFPNSKDLLLGRRKMLFVAFANKPLRPKGASFNMNVLFIQWNVMRNERRPRQADQFEGRIKVAAK